MSRWVFTSRLGGVSQPPFDSFNLASHVGDNPDHVELNRQQLAKMLQLDRTKLFFMNQVHGSRVVVIDENSNPSQSPEADALFTTRKDVGLVTLVADCIPLLLLSTSAIAAVHVGRRGLQKEILDEVIAVFMQHGVPPNEISAQIGPAICGACYEVDEELFEEVVTQIPSTATNFRSNGKPCLDITAGLISQLESFKISWQRENVCTLHDSDHFSYRGASITGRQAGAITLMGN